MVGYSQIIDQVLNVSAFGGWQETPTIRGATPQDTYLSLTKRQDGRRMDLAIKQRIIIRNGCFFSFSPWSLEEFCLPTTAISNCLILFLFQEVLKVWERRAILTPCIWNRYNCFSEAWNWGNQFLENEDKDFHLSWFRCKCSEIEMCCPCQI